MNYLFAKVLRRAIIHILVLVISFEIINKYIEFLFLIKCDPCVKHCVRMSGQFGDNVGLDVI